MLTITFPDDMQTEVSSVDLRALTRQSWDLIVLAIWSFSALTYFHNSKALQFLNSGQAEPTVGDDETSSVAELLMELDFIKWELYEQIDLNKKITIEKEQVKAEFKDLEIQMQETLDSYQ